MHKDSGDTHLILYEGKCGGTECPNCGKRGYRFVGNHSGAFMDLIFECKGDDITDIYSCEHFMSHEETIPLNFRHELEIADQNHPEKNNLPFSGNYPGQRGRYLPGSPSLLDTLPNLCNRKTYGHLR
jgi:hypothetical protein